MPVKQSKRRKPTPVVESQPQIQEARWTPLPFLERYRIALLIALIAIGSVRIVPTYNVFSHTWDEPGHIASGVELLRKHIYQFDQQHPTLTRIAVGIGPALLGMEAPRTGKTGDQWMFNEGRRVLYRTTDYQQTLTAARLGILPFFWVACGLVYLWGKRYAGAPAAIVAVFLFSFFPAVLAHSGLATTDMGCTAMVTAVFLSGCILVERPSLVRGAVFGLCGGLAILAKFSVLAYFPACAVIALTAYFAIERPPRAHIIAAAKRVAPGIAIAAPIAALTVWAGYGFSFANGVPAPELWAGIHEVTHHNATGHWSYLLGQVNRFGFWYFFPVVIAVKTPIAFLVLAAIGIVLAIRGSAGRRLWLAVAFAAGIVAVAMSSHINIGLRHILPMYPALAVLGGAAAVRLWEGSRWKAILSAVLLLWMAASSLLSHPDYLAYFNELAGSQPENILVDSDLDWGQDVSRLGRRLHELGADKVTFVAGDKVDFSRQPGFQGITVSETMSWALPAAGWNAVGLTVLKQRRLGFYDTHPELTLWPNVMPPAERIGKSILLWYFPPNGSVPTLPFGAGADSSAPPAAEAK